MGDVDGVVALVAGARAAGGQVDALVGPDIMCGEVWGSVKV